MVIRRIKRKNQAFVVHAMMEVDIEDVVLIASSRRLRNLRAMESIVEADLTNRFHIFGAVTGHPYLLKASTTSTNTIYSYIGFVYAFFLDHCT
jgi:hypothetical protein